MGEDWGRGILFGQRSTGFSRSSAAFGSAALFVIAIDAEPGPVVAVEVFRGSAVAADVAMTRALVVVLAVLGSLIVRRLSHITLSVRRRARSRRGCGLARVPAYILLSPRLNTLRTSRAVASVPVAVAVG